MFQEINHTNVVINTIESNTKQMMLVLVILYYLLCPQHTVGAYRFAQVRLSVRTSVCPYDNLVCTTPPIHK